MTRVNSTFNLTDCQVNTIECKPGYLQLIELHTGQCTACGGSKVHESKQRRVENPKFKL